MMMMEIDLTPMVATTTFSEKLRYTVSALTVRCVGAYNSYNMHKKSSGWDEDRSLQDKNTSYYY
jgi:hypothetical protein